MFLSQPEGEAGFKKLFEWLEPRGEHRVVLAGSTFGGTGSGVMPVLTSHIKKWAKDRGLTVKIGGVIQVRWFDLGLPDQTALEEQKKVDVTSRDLERNSSCLVEYYRKNLGSMFDSAYLIGHHPHASRRSSGVEQQPEHPHAVNLLSGSVAYQRLHGVALAESRGLLGVSTPDGALEQHLQFPIGKDKNRKVRPLSHHIGITHGQIALGQAVLNVLKAGPANPLEVIEPYPRFIPELVKYSDGVFGAPENVRHEPASTWRGFVDMQIEAMRWLAAVRDQSFDIQACQFSEDLVPPSREIGKLEEHVERLPDKLHNVFHPVLNRVRPSTIAEEPGLVVRRSFYAVRDQLETYLDRR